MANFLPRTAVVIQDGGRLRYALPAALEHARRLRRVYTEWFVTPGSPQWATALALRLFNPELASRLMARSCGAIPRRRVVQHPALLLRDAIESRRFTNPALRFQHRSKLVTQWVRHRGFFDADALVGFIRNLDPALLGMARDAGLRTLADQIILPAEDELAALRTERERFPGWAGAGDGDDTIEPYIAWERETWGRLDHITCPSAAVRDALVNRGVPATKISVVAYPNPPLRREAVDPSHGGDAKSGDRPLIVGFLGTVGLRKGAPWFLEVAKMIAARRRDVTFEMVGRVTVPDAAQARLRALVQLTGPLPASQAMRRLARFDVLLLPTTCEGSAGAVAEALQLGVPVVTTPHAGAAVNDPRRIRLAPHDDPEALAEHVIAFLDDTRLRAALRAGDLGDPGLPTLTDYAAKLAVLIDA